MWIFQISSTIFFSTLRPRKYLISDESWKQQYKFFVETNGLENSYYVHADFGRKNRQKLEQKSTSERIDNDPRSTLKFS